MLEKLKLELQNLADPIKAKNNLWFFKTGKGEYGEGDKFLGVGGTEQRKLAKKYREIPLSDLQKIISSSCHEYRQTSFLILVYKFQKVRDPKDKKKIFDFYLKNHIWANNWDIVDISAPHVVGAYLCDKIDRRILYQYAKSKNLWERRIAIISTFAFIRARQFDDSFKIAEILLNDKHDLIHKAVGWMLREVGNRDMAVEEEFLKKYHRQMPRTMLRYAIEKFADQKRKRYLN